jgi:ParB family chromosome partitioning protein
MKKTKKRNQLNISYTQKTVPVSLIDTSSDETAWDKKELKSRATYFLLNGASEFSVNESENGRFKLLAAERDFWAYKLTGAREVNVRIYSFTDRNAECFSIVERLKTERLAVMDEAYLMKRLIDEFSFTQDDIGALVGKSRPNVANTLRLLTLAPEVIGLIESGKLSAGHARTLVKVDKDKQYAFAEEALKRDYSVREMERAVKAYLTPPEVLKQENAAKAAAKSEELKAFVERMRRVYRTKVSLIGNDKKGRIYIDYYSPEDLYRFEELLDMVENYDR